MKTKMTKQEFIKQFGEDPVDVLGQDWQNQIEDLLKAKMKIKNNEILNQRL